MRRLRTHQFRKNNKLSTLSLELNPIFELGENSLEFDEPPKEVLSQYLYISFYLNVNLTQSSFHPNSGLDRTKRRVYLNLQGTRISSLPAPIFEKFLDAHSENALNLRHTPLICDEKVKWLKDRKEEFENVVEYPFCSNDPGQTIFNSTLIK